MLKTLVLASSSVYRKALLTRLELPFITAIPALDERPLHDEPPEDLVLRLARLKAEAVAQHYPEALIIGSDQVAVHAGKILGKPGNHNNAVAQLRQLSGERVTFLTGLCLLNAAAARLQVDCVTFHVKFRTLTQASIENYVRREQPYDCAGSFKSEGLGIALFECLQGDDHTALIGLPLIRLIHMLAAEDVDVI